MWRVWWEFDIFDCLVFSYSYQIMNSFFELPLFYIWIFYIDILYFLCKCVIRACSLYAWHHASFFLNISCKLYFCFCFDLYQWNFYFMYRLENTFKTNLYFCEESCSRHLWKIWGLNFFLFIYCYCNLNIVIIRYSLTTVILSIVKTFSTLYSNMSRTFSESPQIVRTMRCIEFPLLTPVLVESSKGKVKRFVEIPMFWSTIWCYTKLLSVWYSEKSIFVIKIVLKRRISKLTLTYSFVENFSNVTI